MNILNTIMVDTKMMMMIHQDKEIQENLEEWKSTIWIEVDIIKIGKVSIHAIKNQIQMIKWMIVIPLVALFHLIMKILIVMMDP
jgi:hypothetical protein